MLIPQAIAAFRIAHPHVKLTFQYLAQGALVDRLINHQADLGVTILPVDHPNLQSSPLGQGRLVCVCPEDHPLTRKPLLSVSDLAPYPLIAYDRVSPLGQLVQGLFEATGDVLRPVVEVGSPQNACALVQAGAGIALVDDFSVRSWPSGQIVARAMRDAPTLQANLVHARFEPLSQIALGFIEVLRGQMATYCVAPPEGVSP
jgi:DNA-binding transcriptional LysR family regulator